MKNRVLKTIEKYPCSFTIALMLLMAVINVVIAAYTGPDRTVTKTKIYWERKKCVTTATCDPDGTGYYSCTMTTFTDKDSSCTKADADYFTASACDWPTSLEACDGTKSRSVSGSVVTCDEGDAYCTSRKVVTVTELDPATVSGTVNCDTEGSNGWCIGGATIELSSNEPVDGWTITGIEGNIGTLCGSDSCTYSFPQGTTDLSYWANSSHGDTSYSKSATMKFDSVAPTVNPLSVSGTTGAGNWYRSDVVVSASGADETSGVGSTYVVVDGTQHASPYTITSEGTYSCYGSVFDVAGNSGTGSSSTIRIDKTAPSADFTTSGGAVGSNGWLLTPITFTVAGSDALSGVASENVVINGTAQGSSYTFNAEGSVTAYSVVVDVAGNEATTSSNTYKLDLYAPEIVMALSGTTGAGNWYRSNVFVQVSGSDSGSGIASATLYVNGSNKGSSATINSEGTYTLSGIVVDNAGRETTYPTQTIRVDLTSPTTTITTGGATANAEGWYNTPVTITISGSDALSGYSFGVYSLQGPSGTTSTGTSSVTISDNGSNTFTYYGEDNAGNDSTSVSQTYKIDTAPPVVVVDPVDGTAFLIPGSKGSPHLAALVRPLSGKFTLSGTITDATSGVDYAEYSSNGGLTWKPLTVNTDGTYSEIVDTTLLSSGTTNFMVRAFDIAGLVSTSSISGNVQNAGPKISLTSSWMVYQSGTLEITAGASPVTKVTISICNTDGDKCTSDSYNGSNYPTTINWDGYFGKTLAPSGNYVVTVFAKDSMGRSASAGATIIVPVYATTTPTIAAPAATKKATPVPTNTPQPTATTSEIIVVETPAPTAEAVEEKVNAGPYLVLMAFFGMLGALAQTDPRPKQWKRLAQATRMINEIKDKEK